MRARVGTLAVCGLVLVLAALVRWRRGDAPDEPAVTAGRELVSVEPAQGPALPLVEEPVQRDAEAERVEAAAPEPPPPSPVGELVVHLTGGGRGIEQVRVSLFRSGDRERLRVAREKTDAKGRARFAGLRLGDYRIQVDADDLPEDFMPPREQRRSFETEGAPGVPVTVLEGEQSIVVALERGAFVWGQVRGPDGNGVPFVHVTFGHLHENRAVPTVTPAPWVEPEPFDVDAAGFYEGRLYAGPWKARVKHGPSKKIPIAQRMGMSLPRDHPTRLVPRPWPEVRVLREGTSTRLDFDFGAGPRELRGRILDEERGGFEGLRMSFYPLRLREPSTGTELPSFMGNSVAGATTGSDGGFRITGLRPGRYGICVEPEGFSPLARPGKSVFGKRVDPMEVDLRTESVTDWTVVLPRAQPVEVAGRIEWNPAWRGMRYRLSSARVAVVLQRKSYRERESRRPLQVAKDGSFSFFVDRHEESVLLEVGFREQLLVVPVDLPLLSDQMFLPVSCPY